MIRFVFNVRTRGGQRVDNISIKAATLPDAERRLRQMYQRCEIVECNTHAVARRSEALDMESIIGLISASEPARAMAPARHSVSRDKSGIR